MGIEWHTARFLVAARSSGVDFRRTATLGRQNLFVSTNDIAKQFLDYGVSTCTAIRDAVPDQSEFADGLFKLLGATTYVPIDASSYEGAAEVHDMNLPIPVHLKNNFDVVFDGGTLEHIFNFPTAVQNCMEMVRVGGHLLLQTPANNYCGHGFYQFSPELYFRVLSPENGFEVERIVVCESYAGSQWYEVTDPARLGARVELIGTRQRVILLVQALRTHAAKIFANPPQQSDYVAAWSGSAAQSARDAGRFGIRAQPGYFERFVWKALRLCGVADSRAILERRTWFLNRQLGLSVQPDVFRPVDR